jgi:hypothetical protein
VGKEIDFNGKSHHVVGLATAVAMQPDIALFLQVVKHHGVG